MSTRADAQAICDVLNLCFGWRGADAEYVREAGYTGRVILSARATARVVELRERVVALESRVTYLTRELYGSQLPTAEEAHIARLREQAVSSSVRHPWPSTSKKAI